MNGLTDAELYRRGPDTLVASWQEYARGTARARHLHLRAHQRQRRDLMLKGLEAR